MNDFRSGWAATLGGALLALAAPCLALAQQAMVMDVSGIATTRVGGKATKTELLGYLNTGAELELQDAATVRLVLLSRSDEVALVGPGRWRLQADRVETLRGAAPASTALNPALASQARKFAPTVRDRMAVAAVAMRSSADRTLARQLSPDDTPVLDASPSLWWQAETAGPAEVTIWNDAGAVVWRDAAASPGVRVGTVLPAGRYEWTASVGGRAAPRASFEVASDALRAARPWPAAGDDFSRRLATAMAWDNEGYAFDAWMLWKQLAAERPDSAALAKLAK